MPLAALFGGVHPIYLLGSQNVNESRTTCCWCLVVRSAAIASIYHSVLHKICFFFSLSADGWESTRSSLWESKGIYGIRSRIWNELLPPAPLLAFCLFDAEAIVPLWHRQNAVQHNKVFQCDYIHHSRGIGNHIFTGVRIKASHFLSFLSTSIDTVTLFDSIICTRYLSIGCFHLLQQYTVVRRKTWHSVLLSTKLIGAL